MRSHGRWWLYPRPIQPRRRESSLRNAGMYAATLRNRKRTATPPADGMVPCPSGTMCACGFAACGFDTNTNYFVTFTVVVPAEVAVLEALTVCGAVTVGVATTVAVVPAVGAVTPSDEADGITVEAVGTTVAVGVGTTVGVGVTAGVETVGVVTL